MAGIARKLDDAMREIQRTRTAPVQAVLLDRDVWLAGGVAVQSYTVTSRIVTFGGRTDDRSFTIQVKDR